MTKPHGRRTAAWNWFTARDIPRFVRSERLPGWLALALAGCASTPPEEDPVQIKLNDLETRG